MFINPPPASPWLWAPLLHDRFRSVPSTYAFSSAEASNVAASVCMPPNSTNRYCADLLASASQQKKPLARRRWLISYSPPIPLPICLDVETLWRPVVALLCHGPPHLNSASCPPPPLTGKAGANWIWPANDLFTDRTPMMVGAERLVRLHRRYLMSLIYFPS